MKTAIIALALFVSASSTPSLADEPEQKNENEVIPQVKTRRKRVIMCKECGKPEHQCECEGHDKKDQVRK